MASNTLGSAHSVDTAATFMPIEYKDLDNFILSQFSSVIVIPVATPSIWVWTAVDAAVLHISELLTTTDGAFAVGTDLSVTTVEDTVFVSAANKGLVHVQINIKIIDIIIIFNQNFIYAPVLFNPFIGKASKGKQKASVTIVFLYCWGLAS